MKRVAILTTGTKKSKDISLDKLLHMSLISDAVIDSVFEFIFAKISKKHTINYINIRYSGGYTIVGRYLEPISYRDECKKLLESTFSPTSEHLIRYPIKEIIVNSNSLEIVLDGGRNVKSWKLDGGRNVKSWNRRY